MDVFFFASLCLNFKSEKKNMNPDSEASNSVFEPNLLHVQDTFFFLFALLSHLLIFLQFSS